MVQRKGQYRSGFIFFMCQYKTTYLYIAHSQYLFDYQCLGDTFNVCKNENIARTLMRACSAAILPQQGVADVVDAYFLVKI